MEEKNTGKKKNTGNGLWVNILCLIGTVVLGLIFFSITHITCFLLEKEREKNAGFAKGVIVKEDWNSNCAYVFSAEYFDGVIKVKSYSKAIESAVDVGDEVILMMDDGEGISQWCIVGIIGEAK